MESLRLGGTHRTERLEFLCLIPSVAELSLEQLVFLRVQILEPLPTLPGLPLTCSEQRIVFLLLLV